MLLNDDFLLTTSWGRSLFHDHAEHMPIVDYHCHLDPQQIYEDKHYNNLTQAWLNDSGAGDHYKWRLLRAHGTDERFISGSGDDKKKYLEFVKTIEQAPGNPLYDWSHLELQRVFGINDIIIEENAEEIWQCAQTVIDQPWFSARGLIKKFDVKCICTTDDPISDLKYHALLAQEEVSNGFRVLPTFRPDALMDIENIGFAAYISDLSRVSGIDIDDFECFKRAITQRIDFFQDMGGRLADHGMNSFVFHETTQHQVEGIFKKACGGSRVSMTEADEYRSYLTCFLMKMYVEHGWTMQIHMNCIRNGSTKGLALCGRDSGFDSVGEQPDIVMQLQSLFDCAQQDNALPKMILYSLNSTDWLALASLAGTFEGGDVQHIHFGCAWWFNDTLSGMRQQVTTYAEQSLLGNFVGMLTDSRSFLSYPRHEYFRRILCNILGEWVDLGRLPEDEKYLGKIVEDISYYNARDYFGF